MPRARRRSRKRSETRQKNWQKRKNSPDVPENGILMGMIAVADVIRADSSQAVKRTAGYGHQVVMLTGDNERTAKAIGRQAGVDR